MSELVVVGISDQKIATPPDMLVSYALGSCVGICLYDNLTQISGLAHILLPYSTICTGECDLNKYADTAIKKLVLDMEKQGCKKYRLTAKIAGGANMFITAEKSIGEKNVESVKNQLNLLNINIIAEDTGGNYGRTLFFNPADGSLLIKSINRQQKVL